MSSSSNHQPQDLAGGSQNPDPNQVPPVPPPAFQLDGIPISQPGSAPAEPAEDDHGFGAVLPAHLMNAGGTNRYATYEDTAPVPQTNVTEDDHGFGSVTPPVRQSPPENNQGFGSMTPPPQTYAQSQSQSSQPMNPGYQPAVGQAPPPRPVPPGARVSLTGEIIEEPANAPAAGYMGQTATPAQTMRPPLNQPAPQRPGAPGAPAHYHPQSQSSNRESGGNSGVIGIVLGILAFAGAGFGVWFWLSHRSDPKVQAKSVYVAVVKQDWIAAYDLCAFSPDGKKKYPNAAAFEAESKKGLDTLAANPLYASAMEAMKSSADSITVGEPVVTGDKADVPTAITLNVLGQKLNMKGTAHMVSDGGIWKLDVTGGTAEEINKVNMDLVGRP